MQNDCLGLMAKAGSVCVQHGRLPLYPLVDVNIEQLGCRASWPVVGVPYWFTKLPFMVEENPPSECQPAPIIKWPVQFFAMSDFIDSRRLKNSAEITATYYMLAVAESLHEQIIASGHVDDAAQDEFLKCGLQRILWLVTQARALLVSAMDEVVRDKGDLEREAKLFKLIIAKWDVAYEQIIRSGLVHDENGKLVGFKNRLDCHLWQLEYWFITAINNPVDVKWEIINRLDETYSRRKKCPSTSLAMWDNSMGGFNFRPEFVEPAWEAFKYRPKLTGAQISVINEALNAQ